VRGGIALEPVLGSRSHDTLSGVGPPPIVAGVRLDVGDDPQTELVTDLAPSRPRSAVVRLWPGPRADWFENGVDTLIGQDWTVGRDVSRVGVRLSPGSFPRTSAMPDHMASEGLVDGAVQITPSGEPIVMLANHPTTGGYPVIAVVEPDDIPVVAQARPGSTLRFHRP
jgi:allophanate hydrolase subunit 2